jgi:hypothetical protein
MDIKGREGREEKSKNDERENEKRIYQASLPDRFFSFLQLVHFHNDTKHAPCPLYSAIASRLVDPHIIK